MKKFVLICFLFALVIDSFGQYASRAEPFPYNCPVSVCSGATFRIKFNNLQNFSNGTEIKAVLSNDNFATTTAISAAKYSYTAGGAGVYNTGPLIFSGQQNEVYMDIKIPANMPAGAYKLRIAYPTNTNSEDFNCTGGVINVTTPPVASALASGENTYGDGYWIGQTYAWYPVTSGSITTANVASEDFFNTSNYLGYFTTVAKAPLSDVGFDLNYGLGGIPGTQNVHYSVTNVCLKQTNFSVRFKRTNLPAGQYTFTINADDGIQVKVNGTLVSSAGQWREKAFDASGKSYEPPYTTASMCIIPSDNIDVEYFQRPSQARVTITNTYTPVASPTLSAPAAQTKCVTETAQFTSTVTGSASTNYKWKVSTNNGTNYTDVPNAAPYSGVTSTTLTITGVTTAMSTYMYKMVLDEGASGCGNSAASQPAVLTVNAVPTADITGVLDPCENVATSLTATGGLTAPIVETYKWSDALSTTTAKLDVAGSTTSKAYTVTVYNGTCNSTKTVTVAPKVCSVPSFTIAPYCEEQPCSTPVWTGGTPPAGGTYQIKTAPPSSTATIDANTGVISNGIAGNYTVFYKENATPFTSSDVTVTVYALPIANAGTDVPICNGKDTTLTASGGTYKWDDNSTLATRVVNPTAIQTYTVTVTNANSCTDSDEVVVTVNANPTVNQVDNKICKDNVYTMSPTTNAASPTYKWAAGANGVVVDPNLGTTGVSYSTPNLINTDTKVTYTVTVTDGVTSCSNVANAIITFEEICNPHVTVSNQTICAGKTVTFSATTTNIVGNASYTWNDVTLVGAGPFTVTPASTVTYAVTVVDDYNGESAADTMTITVNALPTANPGVNQTICIGSSATLTVTNDNTTAAIQTIAWASLTGNAPVVKPTTTTTYTVSITDVNSCTDDVITVVNVNPQPTLTFGALSDICVSSNTFDLSIATNAATPAGGTYWCIATPSAISGNNFNATTAGVGTHTIHYRYTEPTTTCSDTLSQTIKVIALPTIAIAPKTICKGETTTLDTTGSFGTLVWDDGTTTYPRTVAPIKDSTFSVTVSINGGCSATNSVEVIVNPAPTVVFDPDISQQCQPLTTNFSNTSTVLSGATYAWDFGDPASGVNNTSTQKIPASAHTYTQDGVYTVTLTVTNPPGCPTTETKQVTVWKNPLAGFTFNPKEPTIFSPEALFTDESLDAVSWAWNFADTASSDNTSDQKNPVHSFSGVGTYPVTLTVLSADDCVNDITIPVKVRADYTIYVPNAFTPNQDDLNDSFYAKGLGISDKNFHMYIFTRWGELIFESTSLTQFWDGTNGNLECPSDQYTWLIQFEDLEKLSHKMIGNVILVR